MFTEVIICDSTRSGLPHITAILPTFDIFHIDSISVQELSIRDLAIDVGLQVIIFTHSLICG